MSEDPLAREVVDACHALAVYGLGSVIGGHVSVRVPGERRYWTNALDRAFEEMSIDDIFLLGFDGEILSGNRDVSPGIDFHPGIYELRPDVNAVVHTHGYWITAQSALARPPRVYHNLATYFLNKTAMSPADDIESIAPALGANDVAIIIPWHGSITIGSTLGEAAALHVTLDYVSRLDVTLSSTPAPEMPPEVSEGIQILLGKADYLKKTWDLMQRKAARSLVNGVIQPQTLA
jgi:ribulose-5-phosphate 4-epimerase/fuculose-1-phosphate aldolase